MPPVEQVFADYRTSGLSLKAHPISFFREQLDKLRVTPAGELDRRATAGICASPGLVLSAAAAGHGQGITFVDARRRNRPGEPGHPAEIWERYYAVARRSPAWIAHGCLENKEGVIHLVVNRLEDLSHWLGQLRLKRSRDFH